jgi:glutamate---cysteine ligase / carboxylate-amine ligase
VEISFCGSPSSSLGVEWELELVDRSTRQLRGGATEILDRLRPDGPPGHPKAKYELLESCIEVITGVCGTVTEALDDLQSTVDEVAAVAGDLGLGLMCSGSHPLSDWADQTISPNPRYARLVDQMQWMARQLQIFGVHVHVGVRSADKAVPIVNALTAYVPHLLALSASSPYWIGTDTGLASYRSKIFEGLPTAGLPYQLSGWTEFEDFMETLISAGTISSIRDVWWDVRPHPDFGTVEVRICDGLPTLSEVGTVAALSQCLVEMFNTQLDRGYVLPVPHDWVVRENKWRAARYGLDAEIITDERGSTVPLRRSIIELIQDLGPVADRLGCADHLGGVHELLRAGASYERQRRVAQAAGGDLRAVVDALLEEMHQGAPVSMAAP